MAPRVGVVLGFVCITAGGLIAAVTAPLHLPKGSWLAAYLVLVCGLVQLVLARQGAWLGSPAPTRGWTQLGLWLAGNVAVIAGTLARQPWIVDAGGAALVAALLIALSQTRGATSRRLAWLLRGLYVAVVVSIPIGLALAHMRAG